ncbi:MAG: sll0787 family AIR synthase-like protein [Cyanobacteria bacterium P01_H01_bin.105]
MQPTTPIADCSLLALVTALQNSVSILGKQDIQTAATTIGQYVQTASGDPIQLGDDCAAIPDGDSYLLLAAEGLWPQLVEQDPWFAGWCAVMVNVSDIASMGGAPIAVVDTLWSQSVTASTPLWQGMQAAAQAYKVPIVGGHTNCHSPYNGLAVAILGRAQQLITSFDAQPGDDLVMVVNMAGSYYGDYPFWNAATTADPSVLQQQTALLPQLAQAGLCNADKDISMGGLVGTLLLLAEASGVGAVLNLDLVPRPSDVTWKKWLTSFPSFGFLFSVSSEHLAQVELLFQPYGLVCKAVGKVTTGSQLLLQQSGQQELFWDITNPLTGFGKQR